MADAELRTPVSAEEVMSRLYGMSQDPNMGDDWRVKVLRRETLNASAEAVAIFDDVRLEHIGSAEMWLSRIAGGGPYYELRIWHSKDPSKPAAALHLPKVSGQPKKIDPAMVKQPGWTGPKILVYPQAEEPAGQVGGGGSAEWGRAAAGLTGPVPAPSSPAEFFAELARRERALDEKRHAAEVEALRREAEASAKRAEERLRDMEARIAAAAQAKPAGPSTVEIVTALGGVLLPVFQSMMQQSHEVRLAMLQSEQKRVEAEAARAAAERGRPLVPPELLDIVKASRAEAADQAKSLSAIYEAQAQMNRVSQEAQATMTRMTLQSMTTVLDLAGRGGEPQEEPWVKVATEGLRAVSSLVEANAAKNRVPRLPPKPVAGPKPPPAKPPPPARGNPKAARPVPPPPPPAPSPLTQPADAPPPDVAPQRQVAGPPVTIDDVERMMRSEDPPATVAAEFFRAIETDEASQAELQEAGGIVEVFEGRFDAAWITAHGAYTQEVADALAREAKARGIPMGDEEPEGEEPSEPAPEQEAPDAA